MSASGILGINQGMDVPGYLDTRPWQYIGSGGLFFMDPSPAMDLFFEPDVHYVPYERHNVDDLIDKYQEMMKHPEKNKSIRLEGFRYVQAHHTAKHRVQMVLDILAGKEISPIYLEDIRSKNKIEEDNNANV
jgi:spore maturation protein CgeB